MNKQHFMGLLILITLCGCSTLTEISKTLWGTSTRALEESRGEALHQTFSCTFEQCFDAVLNMGIEIVDKKTKEITKKKTFTLFLKNFDKRFILFMGIPGNVDTTEVAVFFSTSAVNETKLEIASLSSSAKARVADLVFAQLNSQFPLQKFPSNQE